jgi:hypothetical protein
MSATTGTRPPQPGRPLYPELTARIPDELPEELTDPDCWPEYVIGRIPDPPADPAEASGTARPKTLDTVG